MRRDCTGVLVVGALLTVVAPLMVGQGCDPVPIPTAPDPVADDTDGDGFSNDAETNGNPPTDPFDPADNPDNVQDSDGDGCSDYEESTLGRCDGDPNTGSGGSGQTVTIGGMLAVGENLVIDGDTKDPTNPASANNGPDLTQVQAIPNPCTVGGFLGRIDRKDDVRDVYRVQMAAGQAATLLLADPQANDFDLFLYDEAWAELASSEGIGKAEQVSAPSNGTFLVEVYGYSVDRQGDDGGMYSLLVGEDALTASVAVSPRDHLSSLDEFVEGEVLVKYGPGRRLAAADPKDGPTFKVLNAGEHAGGFQRLRLIKKAAVATRTVDAGGGEVDARGSRSPTVSAIKALRRRGDVEFAEPNYIRRAMAVPNDPFYASQWHYPLISLPDAWDITTGLSSVIVAVVDTGVATLHPDLQGQLVSGYDFVSDTSVSLDGDGIDADPDDPGDSPGGGIPSSFHGTHVAGTIAAASNNGEGTAGVAWNARVMPVRGLGRGGAGTDYDIAQGIRFAAGLSNDSGTVPDQPADVINLSLGGPGFAQVLADAVAAAGEAGVIIVAAAGNENSDADNSYPAAFDDAVSVGAVDSSRHRAPYSNVGSTVAVTAPGGDVQEDANGDGFGDGVLSTIALDEGGFDYTFYEGTSMASPHVAGVVALMKAVNPELTPLDFDRLLAGTHPGTTLRITEDLGAPGRDSLFGHGLINALSAVRAASEITGSTASEAPILQVVPHNLSFGSELASAEIEASNGGVGTLTVSSVTPGDTWLSVSPTEGGEGTYTVTVDRTGLADGVYSSSVTFDSTGGESSVTVRMAVGAPAATGGDVGTLYVLLVHPDTLDTIDQYDTDASQGYAFSFAGVAAGEYRLYAGTDMDDDLLINDEGEAFGGYPVASQTEILSASGDLSGLTFSASYMVNIQVPTSAGRAPEGPASATRALRRILQAE